MPDLEFHALKEQRLAPERQVELLEECKSILLEQGMADMEEYGDMLKWGLLKREGVCRNMHVFHPDWCSFGDQFWGTIHYHGGWIKGHILLGGMEHYTYQATQTDDGTRFHEGNAYMLERHTRIQEAGSSYELPALVPHWIKPTGLTLTYFEEEDTERMGDLLNPASKETDEHTWEQADADALMPQLLALIDARIAELTATTTRAPKAPALSV